MRLRCSVLAVLMTLCFVPAGIAFAQQPPRFEVAVQTGVLRLSDFRFNTPLSIGGRLSFDVTRWLTLEGEADYFHTDNIATTGGMTSVGNIRFAHYRRRIDALFGVKMGARGGRFGAFAKARPGVTHLSNQGSRCLGPGCALVLPPPTPTKYRTEFAFDLGGGVEFYPHPRLVVRAELGDTIIHHRSMALPCPSTDCTTHNLSSRFGVGYRF